MVANVKVPKSVDVRAYQVGFGDCFLLSFNYADGDQRHVLIDFGTTGLRKPVKVSEHMPRVAKEIQRVCGGRLTAVVATHRHADHISGFATDGRTGKSGLIIKALKPKLVLQPWTEDPDARTNARTATRDSSRSPKSFTAGLMDMHAIAKAARDFAQQPPAWMGPSLQRELSFIGEDNIRNKSAIRNLISMGKTNGAKPKWAHYGSSSGLDALLPGVTVHVLGPPNLEQSEKIRKMRTRDPDQFWHLLAGPKRLGSAVLVQGSAHSAKKRPTIPAEARWFCKRLDRMRGDQLLQIVRTLDDQMNNTSLILLFEVGNKKLLFPGDAQIENWSYALQEAPDHDRICKLLKDVDVYKVGHHGSLNATPKTLLWENFVKRNKSGQQRLRTILSTMPGKHGKASNKTEVPRKPLLEALERETQLSNTHELGFRKDSQPWLTVSIPIR